MLDVLEIEELVLTTGWSLNETRDDFMDLIHDAHCFLASLATLTLFGLAESSHANTADMVVAADGSGDYALPFPDDYSE